MSKPTEQDWQRRVFLRIYRAAMNTMRAKNWSLAAHYWRGIALLYRQWKPERVTPTGELRFPEERNGA